MMKLCLIEDDLLLGRGLKASMEDAGHQVTWLRMARDASAWLTSPDQEFDAVVLDLGLPDGEGMDILRLLRRQDKKMATVIITARDTLDQRLDGLDAGADDYLVKPFDNSELLARLRAVMRRSNDSMASDSLLRAGEVSIDEQRMLAHRRQNVVNLSPIEYSLLRELLRHKNRVRTRRQLEAQAMPGSEGQSLDVHISNLRRKIGSDLIRTVRGVGYVVDDNQD